MIVLIGFLVLVFLAETHRSSTGNPIRFRWLFLLTLIVSTSFYSLRVV